VFSLGGCFPPSSLAIDEASYSGLSTTSLPACLQEYHLLFCAIPGNFGYWSQGRICWAEHYISPHFRAGIRFGLSRFRSPLITGSHLISLPAGTQMFPSPAFARLSAHRSACATAVDCTPFGYLWIVDCMHLPRAYRGLPRPSSPPKPSHSPFGVVVSND
jgi:hypothetical protein